MEVRVGYRRGAPREAVPVREKTEGAGALLVASGGAGHQRVAALSWRADAREAAQGRSRRRELGMGSAGSPIKGERSGSREGRKSERDEKETRWRRWYLGVEREVEATRDRDRGGHGLGRPTA
jgi:hypothetical protein